MTPPPQTGSAAPLVSHCLSWRPFQGFAFVNAGRPIDTCTRHITVSRSLQRTTVFGASLEDRKADKVLMTYILWREEEEDKIKCLPWSCPESQKLKKSRLKSRRGVVAQCHSNGLFPCSNFSSSSSVLQSISHKPREIALPPPFCRPGNFLRLRVKDACPMSEKRLFWSAILFSWKFTLVHYYWSGQPLRFMDANLVGQFLTAGSSGEIEGWIENSREIEIENSMLQSSCLDWKWQNLTKYTLPNLGI